MSPQITTPDLWWLKPKHDPWSEVRRSSFHLSVLPAQVPSFRPFPHSSAACSPPPVPPFLFSPPSALISEVILLCMPWGTEGETAEAGKGTQLWGGTKNQTLFPWRDVFQKQAPTDYCPQPSCSLGQDAKHSEQADLSCLGNKCCPNDNSLISLEKENRPSQNCSKRVGSTHSPRHQSWCWADHGNHPTTILPPIEELR